MIYLDDEVNKERLLDIGNIILNVGFIDVNKSKININQNGKYQCDFGEIPLSTYMSIKEYSQFVEKFIATSNVALIDYDYVVLWSDHLYYRAICADNSGEGKSIIIDTTAKLLTKEEAKMECKHPINILAKFYYSPLNNEDYNDTYLLDDIRELHYSDHGSQFLTDNPSYKVYTIDYTLYNDEPVENIAMHDMLVKKKMINQYKIIFDHNDIESITEVQKLAK